MKSRLPAAFVVTFSSFAGGCHDPTPAKDKPEEVHWNPPPQELADAASRAEATDAAATPPQLATMNPPPPRSLNPVDPKTSLMITKADNGCQIDPGSGARPGAPRQKPRQAIPCPAAMKDPAWDNCHNGEMIQRSDAVSCRCVVHGNPPMMRDVACPAASLSAASPADGGT